MFKTYKASHFAAVAVLLVTGTAVAAPLTVTLTPSVASPQTVGTTVNFTAVASGGSGNYDYRFTLQRAGVRQDYSVINTWSWTPSVKEGSYTVAVFARDLANTANTGSRTLVYQITPALISGPQAIRTTNNSMVALFSAAPCPVGQTMRIVFYPTAARTPKSATNDQKCDGTTTMNFLVAGMYANTAYTMFWQTRAPDGTSINVGSLVSYMNGNIPAGMQFPATVMTSPSSPSPDPPVDDPPYPVVIGGFTSPSGSPYTISAFDMKGRPIWVLPYPASLFTRTGPGGEILLMQTPTVAMNTPNPWAQQIRVVDLAGNQTQQTNAAIMSEQLVAMGKHPITQFHHELIRLPNGDFLTLGNAEQLVTNAHQCGSTNGVPNTCDVLGDIVMVLDRDLQLKWAWDAFNQGTYSTGTGTANLIDTPAVLNETCTLNGAGCPPFFARSVANDWMHTNSLQLTADGNIVIGVRHLDWTLKLNYGGGAGDGHIMWRLGKGGDFALTTNSTVGAGGDPEFASFPWYSHPHGTAFAFGSGLISGVQILVLFDNGNTRFATNPSAHSRIQLYAVNEAARQINLNTDIDIGTYAFAVGMAQLLPNGRLWADAGIIGPKPGPWASESIEADNATGAILYLIQMATGISPGPTSFITYRTFRLPSLYGQTI
jgi:arylsulfate sulfotransferase